MPTQRELQALWLLQGEINTLFPTCALLSDNYYWSNTESYRTGTSVSGTTTYNPPYNYAWMTWGSRTVPGESGNTPNWDKTQNAARARCVYELP